MARPRERSGEGVRAEGMAETAVLTGAEQGRRFAALYPAAPQDGLVQVLAPMVRVSNLPMRLLALQQVRLHPQHLQPHASRTGPKRAAGASRERQLYTRRN